MRRRRPRPALVLATAGALLGFALAFAAWRLLPRVPAELPHAQAPAAILGQTSARAGGRILTDVVLAEPVLGRFRLAVSLPDPLPERPLPVLVVLGGLGTGRDNLAHVPPPGDNVLVGYDWPVPPRLPEGMALVREARGLHARLLMAPGQIAAAVDWLSRQPWADAGRVSLLGFSLGALAAPAAQRLAQAGGARIGWTVLAYGGADLGALLAHHPRLRPGWARPALGWLAARLFQPLEPARHLPHLEGRFLIIAGTDDRLVPRASARLLRDLTPEPKTVVLFEGDHMGVGAGQEVLLERILSATEAWLLEQGAVNPRAAAAVDLPARPPWSRLSAQAIDSPG